MVKEEEVESTGPNLWKVAAHATPLDTDWMHLSRKAANEGKGDAVIHNTQYVPVCNHMPVCKEKCETPIFVYLKKGSH